MKKSTIALLFSQGMFSEGCRRLTLVRVVLKMSKWLGRATATS